MAFLVNVTSRHRDQVGVPHWIPHQVLSRSAATENWNRFKTLL